MGLQTNQVRQLKQLQEERAQLRKVVAELSLDKAILQDGASKNVWSTPDSARRDVVDYVASHYELTMRRACRLVKRPRSVQYYCGVKDPCPELRARMRYRYRRVQCCSRREGWQLGKSQAYRLYCEEQLQLR
ncbi:hypothetical protein WJ32_19040 (plasmid) [Burkholderia ubonensis]|uniref:Transposase n=1 Tax=Burkholderia ubonensis TaxID=101571 RepID=A0A118HZI9_9BURK|nr:hypothetical protein WJ32_19040 [Burkholderia ubonensis]KVG77031.1 hypothetical protein WJ33_01655 [Burkholderia ubonensis]